MKLKYYAFRYIIVDEIMSINICGGDDPFARYKRPKVIVNINDRKHITKFTNIHPIAKSLNRNHLMIADFLKKSMNTSYYKKQDDIVFRGIFTDDFIEKKIVLFTQQYVLCDVCKNPETVLLDKNKTIIKSCNACGNIS